MVILYTKDDCPICKKLKLFLDIQEVKYQERNIKDSGFLAEIMMLDVQTLPVLLFNRTILYGDNMDEYKIAQAIKDDDDPYVR